MRGLLLFAVVATSLAAPPAAAQLFDADRMHREQLQRDYQQQQDRAVRDYDARRARERSERAERDARGAQRNYDAVRDLENAPLRSDRDIYREQKLELDAARTRARDVEEIMAPW